MYEKSAAPKLAREIPLCSLLGTLYNIYTYIHLESLCSDYGFSPKKHGKENGKSQRLALTAVLQKATTETSAAGGATTRARDVRANAIVHV